jgi:hypothetical protein
MTADSLTPKLSDAARELFQKYLWELRLSLKGCSSVDPAEVEADVKQHIDQELAGEPAPVSGEKLGEILRKLGSPWQWVPIEELSWWRRIVLRLRTGPSDLRLSAAVFALLVLGLIFVPLTWPFLLASFLLARATLAMTAEAEKELGWQRWLVYPPLIVIYIPILLFVLGWPLAAAGTFVDDLTRSRGTNPFSGQSWRAIPEEPFIVAACFTALTAWWAVVTAVVFVWPTLPMNVFRPMLGRVRRWRAALLFAALVIVTCAGTGALSSILHRTYMVDPDPPDHARFVPQRAYPNQDY